MSRLHQGVQYAARLLLIAGVLVLAYAAYVVIDARAFQADQHAQLEQDRLRPPAMTRALVEGDAVGEILIPRLGMAVSVVEGESPLILQRAVGHLADTALPGEAGNVVMAGHRDTFFRPLRHVKIGDAITVRTRQRDLTYRVESTSVVPADDLQVLEPTDGRTLTLITCFPFLYAGSAPDRFIVRARQTSF